MRFSASLALTGWQKALPEDDVAGSSRRYVRAYLQQINHYLRTDDDTDFALDLDTATGPVLEALRDARLIRRADLLDSMTVVDDGVRRFQADASVRRLGAHRARAGGEGVRRYLEHDPRLQALRPRPVLRRARRGREVRLRDRQRRAPGVQRAGRGLQPGPRQRRRALDEAGQRAGAEPVRRLARDRRLLRARGPAHRGQPAGAAGAHRPAARATPPSTGWGTSCPRSRRTRSTSTGAASTSRTRSPRSSTSSAAPRPRSTAPPTRTAARTSSTSRWRRRSPCLEGRRNEFTEHLVDFALSYAAQVREDHALFVEAFREARIGISAT